ncbi:cytochrome c-type biogenesis protein CcmH [Sphingomonas ginkgonis]|uniref:Cytochrome c-type biogenesis protein n=2 Tax=Sphingomonas ginkgonis TaxID=2315330 RepID=A0A429VAZ2_9SPHN|nr:cytochrome c-type biogenesis protein CcmH [Sphingomonas ginkgonis]
MARPDHRRQYSDHRRRAGAGAVSRVRLRPAVGLVLLLTLPSRLAWADSSMAPAPYAYRQLPDATQEARAKALMEEIRCLVCQGQSIADSDAELAGDMRDMVRRRIASGESPAQVRRWLVGRYGDWISLAPPMEPLTWPLWIAPLLLLVGGGLLVVRRLKRRTA